MEKRNGLNGLQETLIKSFLTVFLLPFRTIGFIFRKLKDIPPKNLLLMAMIFMLLIGVTLVVFIKATSQPGFCVTCHYMRPYFASWKTSTHKDVHCTECHFPPGIEGTVRGKFTALSMLTNYATGVYKKSKPWAEISDNSCLREGCHQTRLLEGKVEFKEGIIFDHKPHLTEDRRGKRLRCTSCHSQIVQGSHMTVTEETCFLCHFKEQQEGAQMASCTFCHQAPVAGDSDRVILFDHTEMLNKNADCRLCHGQMAQGEGNVPKDRCSYCHAEAGKIEKYSQTKDIHQIHITDHKVECNHCHNTILHQSVARTGGIKPDCQACHASTHNEQFLLFSGQGAEGVDPLPSSMFIAGLNCKACHVIWPAGEKESGHWTSIAGAKSCEQCHDKSYYRLYQDGKSILNAKFEKTKSRLNHLAASGKNNSVFLSLNKNLRLIENGKPVHNLDFADRILDETNRRLDEIEGIKPKPRQLPGESSAKCLACHYGMDVAVVKHNDEEFPHKTHVYGSETACNICHRTEKPNHGKLKDKSQCNNCHHKNAAVSCEPCHLLQRELREGTGVFDAFEADVMFDAGLTCRDCHTVDGYNVAKPSAENCEQCHEPGYWEKSIADRRNLAEKSARLLSELNHLTPSTEVQKYMALLESLRNEGTEGGHNLEACNTILSEAEKTSRKGN